MCPCLCVLCRCVLCVVCYVCTARRTTKEYDEVRERERRREQERERREVGARTRYQRTAQTSGSRRRQTDARADAYRHNQMDTDRHRRTQMAADRRGQAFLRKRRGGRGRTEADPCTIPYRRTCAHLAAHGRSCIAAVFGIGHFGGESKNSGLEIATLRAPSMACELYCALCQRRTVEPAGSSGWKLPYGWRWHTAQDECAGTSSSSWCGSSWSSWHVVCRSCRWRFWRDARKELQASPEFEEANLQVRNAMHIRTFDKLAERDIARAAHQASRQQAIATAVPGDDSDMDLDL